MDLENVLASLKPFAGKFHENVELVPVLADQLPADSFPSRMQEYLVQYPQNRHNSSILVG